MFFFFFNCWIVFKFLVHTIYWLSLVVHSNYTFHFLCCVLSCFTFFRHLQHIFMNRFLTAHMQVCLCNCEKCLSFLWLLEVKPTSITICFLSLFCIFVFFTPLSDSRGEISHLWSLSQLNISLMRVSIWSDRLVMKGLCLCEWKLGGLFGGMEKEPERNKNKMSK